MRRISITLIALFLAVSANLYAQPQFRALLFTKTDGYHHQSINEGVDALREISARHSFDLDWQEDANVFNSRNLERFDVIIFLSTTGNVLNEQQQAAMEAFIQSGKGYVGIHSASDTEYEWEWYTQLVGRMFRIHPVIQTAKVTVLDRNFPGLERMPDAFWWTDEWYDFREEQVEDLNYLLAVDESTYKPFAQWGNNRSEGMGDFHPLAWYHEFDGGRAFYTALGHMPETYSDKIFLEHLFGGILWAATGKGVD